VTQVLALSGEVVLGVDDLPTTQSFFCDRLGFRLVSILGADDPEVVVLEGGGLRVRLDRSVRPEPVRLRLAHDGLRSRLVAPNGTVVDLVPRRAGLVVPPLRAVGGVTRPGGPESWHTGRAGMLYRDLVPDRAGGHLIASHIRIPGGGPVPDYVHHHAVSFQLIYCARGWVDVLYEDQGPAIRMQPGDCVLQPPHIRHRVLHCSPGFEVFEVASPAIHETFVDHQIELPTGHVAPDRDFEGQRFVWHRAEGAPWSAGAAGWQERDTGIGDATGNLVRVVAVRPINGTDAVLGSIDRVTVAVVSEGTAIVRLDDAKPVPVDHGCCVVVPAGVASTWTERSSDLEIVTVMVAP
jgi:uncharacterized protein YjlB